jgi:hypothetical protein
MRELAIGVSARPIRRLPIRRRCPEQVLVSITLSTLPFAMS